MAANNARFPGEYRRTNAEGLVERLCGGCAKWLIRTDANFHRNTHGKDGLQDWCKACINDRTHRGAREFKAIHDRAVRVFADTAHQLEMA